MSDDKKYSIGRHRGQFCLVYYDHEGKRRRITLNTNDAREAELIAPSYFAQLTRPRGDTVADLWAAYCADKSGRAVVGTMKYTWRALERRFGHLDPSEITIADCRAHIAERREPSELRPDGIHDGTIHTELGHLRMVLLWAEKNNLIHKAPYIERPSKPRPKESHLTREQAKLLIDSATTPHVRLFIVLALGTGARTRALLDLTWDRCDFVREQIDLRNPNISNPHKGRAIVPMNRMVKEALLTAQPQALSKWVVEWAGGPVQSIKRGFAATVKRANVGHVTPHLLRHSAAIHMAEARVSMEEIAQYLGHNDVNVTRKVYARYSPDFLKDAASVLDYGG